MTVETVEVNGKRALIEYDSDPINPRKDYENFGRMVCAHRRYDLGDDARHVGFTFRSGDFGGWDEVREYLVNAREAVVCLPVYMHDHSGVILSTGSFSDPWDSGQVGFIFATAEDIRECYADAPDALENAARSLRAEVEVYSAYLSGESYRVHFPDGGDDCGGFLGMESAREYARECLGA